MAAGEQLLQLGNLRTEHTKQWIATWNNGSIEVEGNSTIARAVIGSQYYIFSSLPSTEDTSWPFIGLSPSGLAWGDSEVK
jgi:trehalose/maltose hydrolase-like predicted phosphorylase